MRNAVKCDFPFCEGCIYMGGCKGDCDLCEWPCFEEYEGYVCDNPDSEFYGCMVYCKSSR